MKKILALVCAASLAVTLFGCSSGKGDSGDKVYTGTYSRDLEGTTLNVFNWGEYISDGSEDSFDVNKEFEKLTGIRSITAITTITRRCTPSLKAALSLTI